MIEKYEEKANNLILTNLKEREKLIGYFCSQEAKSLIKTIIEADEFSLVKMKYFLIAITDMGIHIHGVNNFHAYKLKGSYFFTWDNLSNIDLKEPKLGFSKLSLEYSDNKLRFSVFSLKERKKIKSIDDETRAYLENKMD